VDAQEPSRSRIQLICHDHRSRVPEVELGNATPHGGHVDQVAVEFSLLFLKDPLGLFGGIVNTWRELESRKLFSQDGQDLLGPLLDVIVDVRPGGSIGPVCRKDSFYSCLVTAQLPENLMKR
jgi:hypothetical protein